METAIQQGLNRLLLDFRYCIESNEIARRFDNPPDVVEYYRGKAEAYREILAAVETEKDKWDKHSAARLVKRFRTAAKRFLWKANAETAGTMQDYYDGCFEAYEHAVEWIEMVFPPVKVVSLSEWRQKKQAAGLNLNKAKTSGRR